MLFEETRDVIYHATNLPNLKNILETNSFILTSIIGAPSEEKITPPKKYYFLSLSRSKLGSYHTKNLFASSVLLVLNYDKLRKNYKIFPVDYWEGKKLEKEDEMEERLVSEKPEIPNAKNFIEEIHIYVNREELEKYPQKKEIFRETLKTVIKSRIPYYLYFDSKAFVLLDRKRAYKADVKELKSPEKVVFPLPDVSKDEKTRIRKIPRGLSYRSETDYPFSLTSVLELLKSKNTKNPSKGASNLLYYLKYRNEYDIVKGIGLEFFNNRFSYSPERKALEKIVSFMKRNRIFTVEKLVKYLKKKYSIEN